jgi:hypothetical protein
MIPAKINFVSFKDINALQERTKLLIVPDHAQHSQVAWGFKCLYSPEDSFQGRHHTLVLYWPYVRQFVVQNYQCLIAPAALSNCKLQINVTLCRYCSIMDWQNRSGWYSGALYTESDESSWHTATESSQVSCNIIPLIYNHKVLSEFQTKFVFFCTFLKRLTCTTNPLLLKPIAILPIIQLTSPQNH